MKSCPACGSALVAAPQRPALLGCARCGGVWADVATSTDIVEKLDAELAKLADVAAELAAKRVGEPLPEKGRVRCCPDCGTSLDRVHQASTNLDVCTAHGTWFDRGELSRVIKILEHERKLKDPKWRASNEYRVVSGNTSLNTGGGDGGGRAMEIAGEAAAGAAGEFAVGFVFIVLESLLSAATDD